MILINLFITLCIHKAHAFLPASIQTNIIDIFGTLDQSVIGQVSESLSHEQILRRGLTRSLYQAFYGKWYCQLDIDKLLKLITQPNKAIVDFDSATTKLPYAHFDGETFSDSNQRVIDLTAQIYQALSENNYQKAQILSDLDHSAWSMDLPMNALLGH
jgi:hypothetical protein